MAFDPKNGGVKGVYQEKSGEKCCLIGKKAALTASNGKDIGFNGV